MSGDTRNRRGTSYGSSNAAESHPTRNTAIDLPRAAPPCETLPYATAKAAQTKMMVSIAHLLNKRVWMKSVLIGTVITGGLWRRRHQARDA